MAVKIFAKISYNINGVASPSIILASAWVDELNEMNDDTQKILSFYHSGNIPFLAPMGDPMGTYVRSDVNVDNIPNDKSLEEILSMFGVFENEKYPSTSYFPLIGYIGSYIIIEKLVILMNNLAYDTANGVDDIEPAKVFFYIHKLTADEIDSFADSQPELNTVDASVTDLYDLLLPHVATKNNALEADGYRQATQNGNAIVLYADCITYLYFKNQNPKEIS